MTLITLGKPALQTIERAQSFEWLETNGLGGYAASSVALANTRRYHGLLVVPTDPPLRRMVLLSKIEEEVRIGESPALSLGTNFYPGAVYPRGFEHLNSFSHKLFPTWEFTLPTGTLRKTVAMLHGKNTVIVVYWYVSKDPSPLQIQLSPFLAGREYHSLLQQTDLSHSITVSESTVSFSPPAQTPPLIMRCESAHFEERQEWYRNYEYPADRARGYDFRENLFRPGSWVREMLPGQSFGFIASTDPLPESTAVECLDREQQRRRSSLDVLPVRDEMSESLALAAQQFLIELPDQQSTIIAGYPWFTDWGRDTMISLTGITLITRRFREAKSILNRFKGALSQGMIPNYFSDRGELPHYNTADASLWFFIAAFKYFSYSSDIAFVRDDLIPAMKEILRHHREGTRFGIKEDNDGLLLAGSPDTQLTWMDARADGRPVTSRHGKAVELNALWYNAHLCLAMLCRMTGQRQDVGALEDRASRIHDSFNKVFWSESAGCCFDCVRDSEIDGSIRPNQIFAVGLPFPLLVQARAIQLLAVVERDLYTPYGLRTLARTDPNYRGTYEGSPFSRDTAYHQGTVWPWLLGPYITALVRYRGALGVQQSHHIINRVKVHLQNGCIGTLSEIFDGDAPHFPRGAFAQAWSVAEIYRAYIEDVLGRRPSVG